jgi:hypothetical protein
MNGSIMARGALKARRAVNPLTRIIAESDPFHVGHSSVVSSAWLRSDCSSYGMEDVPFADPSGATAMGGAASLDGELLRFWRTTNNANSGSPVKTNPAP